MKAFGVLFLLVIATQMGLTQAGPTTASLSHDGLPYDGSLVEYKFEADSVTGIYKLAQYETYYDRVQGKKITRGPIVIWEGLDCLVTAQSVYCSADSRPVDGALVEFYTATDGSGTYRLQEKITSFSREFGKEIVTERTFAEFLNLTTF